MRRFRLITTMDSNLIQESITSGRIDVTKWYSTPSTRLKVVRAYSSQLALTNEIDFAESLGLSCDIFDDGKELGYLTFNPMGEVQAATVVRKLNPIGCLMDSLTSIFK